MSYTPPSKQVIEPLANYPAYMVRKEGIVLLSEADWAATIGFKFGTFIDGAGTVISDSNHYFGGSRSVKCTTDAVATHAAEIKITTNYPLGAGIYALEMKWAWGDPAVQFGNSTFHMGIEPREVKENGFYQSRIRARVTQNDYQYETDVDVYTSFNPPAVFERPNLDGAAALAGDRWQWCRLVIDTRTKTYVKFEYIALNDIRTIDMSGIPLVIRGTVPNWSLLFFALVATGAGGAENVHVTDWVISKLDNITPSVV